MKSGWLLFALAATALSQPAFAQVTSSSNSGATSGSSSTAVNAPVNNGNSSANSSSGSVSGSASYSTGGTSAASSQAATAGNSQSSSNVVNYNTPATQTVRTAPAIVAPALTTTLTETCMGSTSLGVSVVGVGATGATTWNDGECVRRLNARELNSMGFHTEACWVLRVNKDVDNAFARSGNRCENWVQPGQAAQGASAPTGNPRWGAPSGEQPPAVPASPGG